MSRSLLKKALQLYDQEEKVEDVKKTVTKAVVSQPKKKKKSLVERKREAKKNKMKLKTSVQEVKIGFILDEVRKETNVDNTKKNLRILKKISKVQKNVVRHQGLDKIMRYARGRLAKNSEKEKPQEQTKSIFNEEDFKEFEKTFFVKEEIF